MEQKKFAIVRFKISLNHSKAVFLCQTLNCREIGITKEFSKNKIPIYILDLNVFAAEKRTFGKNVFSCLR